MDQNALNNAEDAVSSVRPQKLQFFHSPERVCTNHSLSFQMRDFLQVYNYMSESCFLRCINDLTTRELTNDESHCIDLCSIKHINVNHKVMTTFVELQPAINQRRLDEAAEAHRKTVENLELAKELQEKNKKETTTVQAAQVAS